MVEDIEHFYINNLSLDNIEEKFNVETPKFLYNFLEFICFSKKVDIENQNKILINFKKKFIEISLKNIEKLEEFIIVNLVSYQRMKNNDIVNDIKKNKKKNKI